MQKNIYIAFAYVDKNNQKSYGGILLSAYDFETLNNNIDSIEKSDFASYNSTDWGGIDEIERICDIKQLSLTGRKIKLHKPIQFKGADDDNGHEYKWTVTVCEIWEVVQSDRRVLK